MSDAFLRERDLPRDFSVTTVFGVVMTSLDVDMPASPARSESSSNPWSTVEKCFYKCKYLENSESDVYGKAGLKKILKVTKMSLKKIEQRSVAVS